ncbi:MAG: Ig-like domain-containing protein [Candidatus Neomarinimicrobiota bacterium]
MKTHKSFNILFLLLILGCNTGPVFDINDDGDTIPPIITITYPADQSVLSDTVRLSVYAFDDRELDNVVIYIDSSAVLTEIDTPFTLTYDWITTDPNLEGVHTIWAIAEDIGGNINKTKPIQVTIDNYDDQNPEGLIIYPYSGQTLAGSVNILIQASDNEEISKVTIHVNGDQIAEIIEEPYQFLWETNDLIDDILYEIHAQVYDNSDNKTLLGPIAILLDNNDPEDITPPVGSIISPSSAQTVNGNVNIIIETYDDMTEEPLVTISINETVVVDEQRTYFYDWITDNGQFPDGEYVIRVDLKDNYDNRSTLYPVLVTVNNGGPLDITAPLVEIMSPSVNETIQDEKIVEIRASDVFGINRVEIYFNNEIIGTEIPINEAQNQFEYNLISTNYNDGDHILYAMAYDNNDNQAISNPFTIHIDNIDNESPSGSIIYPYSGQTVSSNISIQIEASDNVQVHQVQLLIEGAYSGDAIQLDNIWSFDWDTDTGTEDSQNQIYAIIRDLEGNSFNTSPILVTVDNDSIPNEDFTPPIISILNPISGQTVGDTVIITAFATDNYGIDYVELFINGSLIENLEEEPYSYAWDTYTLENNSEYTINMIAKDIHNNETSAQPIFVNIQNEYQEIIEEFTLTEQTGAISLSWSAALNAESYIIKKDNIFLIQLDETTYDDIVSDADEHCYTISAVNAMNLIGPESNAECGTAL